MTNPHIPHPWIEERKKQGPHFTNREHQSVNGRIALFITKIFGSMGMFYFLLIWVVGWIFLASIGFSVFKADPYPFTFLLLLSNMVQLFALPILAVGQQIQSRVSDRQAEQTYKDAEAILMIQNQMHELIEINTQLTEEIHAMVKKQDT